jgi:hypothetical protein
MWQDRVHIRLNQPSSHPNPKHMRLVLGLSVLPL